MVARTRDPGVLGDRRNDAEELPRVSADSLGRTLRPKKHGDFRQQVSLQVSRAEHRKLKAAATRAGVPLSDLLRSKLESWMKRLPEG